MWSNLLISFLIWIGKEGTRTIWGRMWTIIFELLLIIRLLFNEFMHFFLIILYNLQPNNVNALETQTLRIILKLCLKTRIVWGRMWTNPKLLRKVKLLYKCHKFLFCPVWLEDNYIRSAEKPNRILIDVNQSNTTHGKFVSMNLPY